MFIYTVNFNEAIQTGIRLLVDINHLLRNTLADPKSESVPPYNKKHSATARDMLQSTDVALDVHKVVLAVSLLDLYAGPLTFPRITVDRASVGLAGPSKASL